MEKNPFSKNIFTNQLWLNINLNSLQIFLQFTSRIFQGKYKKFDWMISNFKIHFYLKESYVFAAAPMDSILFENLPKSHISSTNIVFLIPVTSSNSSAYSAKLFGHITTWISHKSHKFHSPRITWKGFCSHKRFSALSPLLPIEAYYTIMSKKRTFKVVLRSTKRWPLFSLWFTWYSAFWWVLSDVREVFTMLWQF